MQGDVREKLAELPEKSVQCVVTSPPYWGLRDYGLPPSVWGGDPECEHEWGVGRNIYTCRECTKQTIFQQIRPVKHGKQKNIFNMGVSE